MSSRCKLVSPSTRGARAGSGQRSGRQQHPYASQRGSYVETQEQNGRLRLLNATLRNQNMELARELNEAKSMLRLSRQKERETERRLIQREASARGRRPAVTRSFSTDDARPRLAAEQTPLRERGERQGGCATRVGDIKEHRGREVDKSHQSRGVSSSCHGVDSGSLVDENTERPPLGTPQAWHGTIARARPAVVTPVSPPPGSPDAKAVHRAPKEAPAIKKGGRRSSLVPEAAFVNLRGSSQERAAASLLAEPAAERVKAAPVQRTPERGCSRLLCDTTALSDDTAARNRDAADEADARELPEDGVLLADPEKGEEEEEEEAVDTEADAESSRTTTPAIIEYECSGQDTPTGLRHQAADNSSSYYSCPPGQLISARGYSQSTPPAITGAAAGRTGGGGTGLFQAAYFGASSVEAARNDPGQQYCAPWVPPASASQPTSSQEVVAQPATNSRPRRGVARPLSYQEPSLNIKMRKGHVMFPTAKERAARPKSPANAASQTEKENGKGGSSDKNGVDRQKL